MTKERWEELDLQMKRSLKLAENDRQWIVQHYWDSRANPVEQKVKFDNESRTAIAYYKSVIDDLNTLRVDAGIDLIL